MSATAAFGQGDWLGRFVEELRCGSRATMGRSHPGAKGWGGPPWFAGWASGWRGPGDWKGSGDWWSGGSTRPRAARGELRTAILALLREQPRHGYQIIQDIAERSGGAWRASPGSVYPALAALQDEGLIDDEKIEGRRVYSLTEAGRAHVEDRREQLDEAFAAYDQAEDDTMSEDYGRLLFGVGAAAVEVARAGSEDQVADARQLLAQVRRDLYAVLADDDQADDGGRS